MPRKSNSKMRIAMPAWEIGRVESGFGVKIGELGEFIEQLPPALVKAAAKYKIDLEVVILTPCFAHYDRSKMTKLKQNIPVVIEGTTIGVEAYEYTFPDGQKVVYFWDERQLQWTSETNIYPADPQTALRYFATLCQAMAGYIKQDNFDTIHLHDYHVGLVPFYLGNQYLREVPVHLTVHNATFQGVIPPLDNGYNALLRIGLNNGQLFNYYFNHHNNINMLKGCMQNIYEMGGKIATISGDIHSTWGYAAELRMSHEMIRAKATAQKGMPPGDVFVANGHLDLFEKLPLVGITNGLSAQHRPENIPELKANVLKKIQKERGPHNPIYYNPTTQREMLAQDHNFDADHLEMKAELRRLLHLEAFGIEPHGYPNPIIFTAVGQLVERANFGLLADIIERVLRYDHNAKFIVLASIPPVGNVDREAESALFRLADRYRDRVYFNNSSNRPLSRLILAGGDFALVLPRYEPCGTIDYEASLVGTVVIGHAVGGVNKVRRCAYLYEWLDTSDQAGEANALFEQVRQAINMFRNNPNQHVKMVQTAMAIETSWDNTADEYVGLYRYGRLNKEWYHERQNIIDQFIESLGPNKSMFTRFFVPDRHAGSDDLDWQLKNSLEKVAENE